MFLCVPPESTEALSYINYQNLCRLPGYMGSGTRFCGHEFPRRYDPGPVSCLASFVV